MIYEHMLTFNTAQEATNAEHVVLGLIDPDRIKASEYRDRPVVMIQTEQEIDQDTYNQITDQCQPVSTIFNLTEEQGRLYARLVSYCTKHHMWCGDAAKLAQFAALSYPFDPNIVYGLVVRGLIKHNAISSYHLTIEK